MVDNSMPPNMGPGGMGVPVGEPTKPMGNPLKQHLRQPKIYITLPSKNKGTHRLSERFLFMDRRQADYFQDSVLYWTSYNG